MKYAVAFFSWFFILVSPIQASSSYVLPYPSAMPGSKFYALSVLWDRLEGIWSFGNFSQFHYNLKQADKYLVEAKILFDYDQYLLGIGALRKSNEYFVQSKKFLMAAEKEGKNISEKKDLYILASMKHSEELQKMKESVPEEISWQPEKQKASLLRLHEEIEEAMEIRQTIV